MKLERADAHRLRARRPQSHLDPFASGVENRDVLERVDVEVGVELTIDHVEHVLVELGGDAGRVVVGGLERRHVLDQVEAEQEPVARLYGLAHAGEEGRRLVVGSQVADGAAEEDGEPRAGVGGGQRPERIEEVGRHAVHAQAGVVAHQLLADTLQRRLVDVDRHVEA